MYKWVSKSKTPQLASVVQHSEGLAFATVSHKEATKKPRLEKCFFQPQLSDVQTTLQQLLQQSRRIKQPVTTLLNSSQFTLLLMQRPNVDKDELIDAVRWQIKDQLNYPAEEAIIEVLDIPGQQERGRTPMIYTVATHQDILKSSINLLEDSNLNLKYIDIPELAQRNISSLLPEDFIGVALLNLQATSGLLTITHEGELYLSRVIDVGYEHLEIEEDTSDEDSGLSLEETTSAFEVNFGKIVLEIQRSLDYYESHYGKATIGNLIIAPLENEIPCLNEKLEQELGLAVRNLSLDEIVESETALDIEIQSRCFTAIGAALRLAVDNSTLSKFE